MKVGEIRLLSAQTLKLYLRENMSKILIYDGNMCSNAENHQLFGEDLKDYGLKITVQPCITQA